MQAGHEPHVAGGHAVDLGAPLARLAKSVVMPRMEEVEAPVQKHRRGPFIIVMSYAERLLPIVLAAVPGSVTAGPAKYVEVARPVHRGDRGAAFGGKWPWPRSPLTQSASMLMETTRRRSEDGPRTVPCVPRHDRRHFASSRRMMKMGHEMRSL